MSEYRRRTSDEVVRQIESLKRARHKIFIGAAAGVGKTYAMLREAHSLRESGIDVVAGIIESHGRHETSELLEGLEAIAPIEVPHSGIALKELDVEAVLRRQPDVVLIDELAHSNPPGLRHEKRYEDVRDILEAGINVHSTLNVQHLQSLNDIVAQVTGVRVRETVPDSVVTQASELRLIDLAPEALVQRMREGRVYPPEQARRAMENFFRVGNLTALRELALRAVADRTDEDLDVYMRMHNISGPWPTKERVLVCVTGNPAGQVLVRRGYRMAQRLRGDLFVAAVTRPGHTPGLQEARNLDQHLRLAREFGAEVILEEAEDSAGRLVHIAKEVRATQIILGESRRSRWAELLHGSVIERILHETRDADVLIVARTELGDGHT